MTDYYKTLGIERSASASEVKSAFRKLAFKHHPDRHANSSEHQQEASSRRFKELAEAYEVLSDEKKRTLYNRVGRAGSVFRHGADDGYRNAARGGYPQGRGFHPGSGGRRTAWPLSFRWNFSFGFGRADYIFHGLIFTMAIIGFTAGGSAADGLWRIRNSGKSFEETIQAVEARKQGQNARDGAESSPTSKQDSLAGKA